MIIIKEIGEDCDYLTIAGEILNFETSTRYFSKGKLLIVPEEHREYPKLADRNIQYTIRATIGYIYVSPTTDLEIFENKILLAVLQLECQLLKEFGVEVLKNYHTVMTSINTNVKVKSALALTKDSKNCSYANNGNTKNIKRQFSRFADTHGYSRFTWLIRTIDEFKFQIRSDDVDDAISRFIISIFYDSDNICKLDHLTTTFDFSLKDLKGSDKIINEKILLFMYGMPLQYELSEHWCNNVSKDAKIFLRNIDETHLFEVKYEQLTFKPVKRYNSNEASLNICSKCYSQLFGDNYALFNHLSTKNYCIAVCPPCLHDNANKSLDSEYQYIYRVTFPTTVEEMCKKMSGSDERMVIRIEAAKKIERKELHYGKKMIKYILLGDKYVAFEDINDYLFLKLSVDSTFTQRKICLAKILE